LKKEEFAKLVEKAKIVGEKIGVKPKIWYLLTQCWFFRAVLKTPLLVRWRDFIVI
jgi:hypothetical protein